MEHKPKHKKEMKTKTVKKEDIDLNALKNKINKEKDVGKIDSYLNSIASASEEFRKKLVESIDLNLLKEKIDKEEDIKKIGDCIKDIGLQVRKLERS